MLRRLPPSRQVRRNLATRANVQSHYAAFDHSREMNVDVQQIKIVETFAIAAAEAASTTSVEGPAKIKEYPGSR